MEKRAAPYALAPGESRRHDAILPFKALASDTGGLLSICEFALGPWQSGPVLHLHTSISPAATTVASRTSGHPLSYFPLKNSGRTYPASRGNAA